jgi:hypothetical protein
MSAEELNEYARDGKLPDFINITEGATGGNGQGGSEND